MFTVVEQRHFVRAAGGRDCLSRTKGREDISNNIREEISPHCVRRNDRSPSMFTVEGIKSQIVNHLSGVHYSSAIYRA